MFQVYFRGPATGPFVSLKMSIGLASTGPNSHLVLRIVIASTKVGSCSVGTDLELMTLADAIYFISIQRFYDVVLGW